MQYQSCNDGKSHAQPPGTPDCPVHDAAVVVPQCNVTKTSWARPFHFQSFELKLGRKVAPNPFSNKEARRRIWQLRITQDVLGTYPSNKKCGGSLKRASAIPHQDWVTFSCKILRKRSARIQVVVHGCFLISLHYTILYNHSLYLIR